MAINTDPAKGFVGDAEIVITIHDGKAEPLKASCPTKGIVWSDKDQRSANLPEVFRLLSDAIDDKYEEEASR